MLVQVSAILGATGVVRCDRNVRFVVSMWSAIAYDDEVGLPPGGRGTRLAGERALLKDPCGDCRHPWSEHPGADFDATLDGICGECTYEKEHEGRAEMCRLHAPDDVVRDIRVAFVVNVAPQTPGWDALLRVVRPDAFAISLDIPERDEWSPEAAQAAALLRRKANLKASVGPRYSSISRLVIDEEVWAAFRVLAGLAYDATVLRSPEGWDPVLDFSDEGTSVVATLTPVRMGRVDRGGWGRCRPAPERAAPLGLLAERTKAPERRASAILMSWRAARGSRGHDASSRSPGAGSIGIRSIATHPPR